MEERRRAKNEEKKAKKKEYMRKYYLKHKEVLLQRTKDYHKKVRDGGVLEGFKEPQEEPQEG